MKRLFASLLTAFAIGISGGAPSAWAADDKPAAPAATAPAAAAPAAPAPGEGLIEYADFARVQLRTARVLEAEKVAGADKLLKLQIQVGEERRQIIAGIAKSYTPEQIVGKTVVVVVNLKPAKIRGVESNGMLLAATVGDQLRVVTLEGDEPSGAVVK